MTFIQAAAQIVNAIWPTKLHPDYIAVAAKHVANGGKLSTVINLLKDLEEVLDEKEKT